MLPVYKSGVPFAIHFRFFQAEDEQGQTSNPAPCITGLSAKTGWVPFGSALAGNCPPVIVFNAELSPPFEEKILSPIFQGQMGGRSQDQIKIFIRGQGLDRFSPDSIVGE